MTRPDKLTLAAYILTIIFGGCNAVAVRFTVAELPPFWGAALRFAAASLIFWFIALIQRERLPRGRSLTGILIYGILMFGASYALIYWGLRSLQASMAQVILALVPLLTFFFAILHGMESFRWQGLLGAILAFGGILLAFFDQPGTSLPLSSLLALVGGAACMAEGAVVIKGVPKGSPLMTNALAMSAGTVLLLGLSLIAREPWQMPTLLATWSAIGYLVIFGSVLVFYLFLFVIRRWAASTTSYQLVLMPFVTVIVAAWLADEKVNWVFLLGGALAVFGVWVGAFAPSLQKILLHERIALKQE
jgi:drug/metabolite transporter (DMT)-like permease